MKIFTPIFVTTSAAEIVQWCVVQSGWAIDPQLPLVNSVQL